MTNSNTLLAPAPHSLEAEQAVLGAILLDNSVLSLARDLIAPEDFYRTAHRVIFETMVSLTDGGKPIDNITLAEAMNGKGQLASVGGAAYLGELLTAVSSATNIATHARIVAEKSKVRTLRNQLLNAVECIEDGADWEKLAPLVAQIKDVTATHDQESSSVGEFAPVSLAQLLEEPEPLEPEWVLEDILSAGSLSAIVSKPKVGKSTLVYEGAVAVANGKPFLGRKTKCGGVLFLATEEHRREVKRRLRNLGADKPEAIHVHAGDLKDSPDTLHALVAYIKQHSIVLVIFDTLNSYWSVTEENDAGTVTQAIKPILQLARETNAAVLLIHHARKSDGDHGDEIRGSGALFSLLDVALILKRHEVETQRHLTIISRYAEAPPELLLELREHGYVSLGDPAANNKATKLGKLEAALSIDPQKVEALAKKAGVAVKAAYTLLDLLAEQGKAAKSRTGKKNDPFLFAKCVSVSPLEKGGSEATHFPQPNPSAKVVPPGGEFVASTPPSPIGAKETNLFGTVEDSFLPTPVPPGSNESESEEVQL